MRGIEFLMMSNTAPKPLSFIEITEMRPGADPKLHKIEIDSITLQGITLGRSGDIKICEKTPREIWSNVGRKQATLYAINESGEKHIYLRCGYQESGIWKYSGMEDDPPKMKGTGVWLGNGPIDPEYPIDIRPGAFVKLVPKIANYQCILVWGLEKNGDSQPPTVPMNAEARDQLYFENRTLKEQAAVKDIQINKLRELADQQKRFADQQKSMAEEMRAQAQKLASQISRERDINRAQDTKISRIKKLGAVAVISMLISLGVDIEQLDKILEIVALVASGGLIWTSAEKARAE